MIREEINRLLFTPNPDDISGVDIMEVHVSCDADAWLVLERLYEVLTIVLSTHLLNSKCNEDEMELQLQPLETWFKENIIQYIKDTEDTSTSTDYLEGFHSYRDWFWWNARGVDENNFKVYILLDGFPVSGFDSLRWLIECCGAVSVEQGDMIDPHEIDAS